MTIVMVVIAIFIIFIDTTGLISCEECSYLYCEGRHSMFYSCGVLGASEGPSRFNPIISIQHCSLQIDDPTSLTAMNQKVHSLQQAAFILVQIVDEVLEASLQLRHAAAAVRSCWSRCGLGLEFCSKMQRRINWPSRSAVSELVNGSSI